MSSRSCWTVQGSVGSVACEPFLIVRQPDMPARVSGASIEASCRGNDGGSPHRKELAAYGARQCFGLLGTADFKMSDALVGAGVKLISAGHEDNTASMAAAV